MDPDIKKVLKKQTNNWTVSARTSHGVSDASWNFISDIYFCACSRLQRKLYVTADHNQKSVRNTEVGETAPI